MACLSFPLRMRDGGTLQRTEEPAAVLAFLQVMALTPGGSWQACAEFGLRDLLENPQRRADVPRLAAERANRALQALGFETFKVSSIVRELSQRADIETYSVTLLSTRGEQQEFSSTLTAPVAT